MSIQNSGGGKKGKRVKLGLMIIAIAVMVVFTTAFLGFRYYTGLLNFDYGNRNNNGYDTLPDNFGKLASPDKPVLDVKGKELASGKDVQNILLIGADKDDGSSRSDSMILVTVNEISKEIVLTSFLRDLYVTIPERDERNRLNAAYSYGGTDLLIETLQYNFGISIDGYASIGFEEFENVVDILGGVTVAVTDAEEEYLEITANPANKVYMDGAWALRFVRIRKLDSDFQRTDRQRRLLIALMSELKSAGVSDLNKLMHQILPQVTTDLSEKDFLNFIMSWGNYSSYDMVTNTIPVEDSYKSDNISGMDVLVADMDANRTALKDSIYEGVRNMTDDAE